MTTPEYKVVEWSGEPGLMVLADDMATECGIEDFSPGAFMEEALYAQRRMDNGIFVMIIDGEVVGGIIMSMISPAWTRDYYASARFMYIRPEHGGAIYHLISAMRKWSLEKRCTVIQVCSNVRCRKDIGPFLKKKKFKKEEIVYTRDV